MDLNEFAKDVHTNAVLHGFWTNDKHVPEIIALCHSELSEALEEYRNDKPMLYIENGKPEGIGIELMDCIIRILDYCEYMHFDVETALKMKHEYNITRPWKHGKKI